MINMGNFVYKDQDFYYSNNFQLGILYYLSSNRKKAIYYFRKEQFFLENEIKTAENDDRIYRILAIVNAALGEKPEAINASNKTVQLLNNKTDAILEVSSEIIAAYIYLMLEEYEKGIPKLEYLLEHTGKISTDYLRNHYMWRGFMKNEKYRALVTNTKMNEKNN